MRLRPALPLLLVAAASIAAEPANNSEVIKVATTYLNAISGQGDDSGRELLLGGATENAQLFTLENWRIVSREAPKSEDGDLGTAHRLVEEMDKAGHDAMASLMGDDNAGDKKVQILSGEDARKIMGPTREKAKVFQRTYPVLAYVIRVDRDVYWHPKNPMRALLAQAGAQGRYHLDFNLFNVETTEGPRKVPRVWPLRVIRFRSGKLDTGWKVLPASDWKAE